MQSCTRTAVIQGSSPRLVDIESTVTSGFAGLQLVGNTSDLCRDGKERAKTALEGLGFRLGQKRILINLAPADCRKEGNHFDLPIAVSLAILISEREPRQVASEWLFAAELGLDGSLRPVRAVIPLALVALEHGLKGIVLSEANREEINTLRKLPQGSAPDVSFLFFRNLSEVFRWLFEDERPQAESLLREESPGASQQTGDFTFEDMHMTESMKTLAVCAAVGRHNMLLRGTPGSGKSMFAQRLPSLLPLLPAQHHFEVLQLYSLKWEKIPESIVRGIPPIRNPHHSSSPQALLGTADVPGDMALAHGGVLFLDELTEFRRDLLESLREPLETGALHISRAQGKAIWRADLQLITACNNCPCGNAGSKVNECKCGAHKVQAYLNRLSGPLMDRIDIHFTMPEVECKFFNPVPEGQHEQLLAATERARRFMTHRNEAFGVTINRDLKMDQLLASNNLDEREKAGVLKLMGQQKLSARAFLKSLRVARTLADMEERPLFNRSHFLRAITWQQRQSEPVRMIPQLS